MNCNLESPTKAHFYCVYHLDLNQSILKAVKAELLLQSLLLQLVLDVHKVQAVKSFKYVLPFPSQ